MKNKVIVEEKTKRFLREDRRHCAGRGIEV